MSVGWKTLSWRSGCMERKLAKVGVEDALSALGETKHKKALLSIDVNASKKERHLN